MRPALALAAILALARAGEKEEVQALLGRLASEDVYEREIAQRALEALGPDALPLLEEADPAEPEARRLVGLLQRGSGTLRIDAAAADAGYPLGTTLRLEIRIQNLSDEQLLVQPAFLESKLCFARGIGEVTPNSLEGDGVLAAPPGATLRFFLHFPPDRLPIRRPGRYDAVVKVRAVLAQAPAAGAEPEEGAAATETDVRGTSARLVIEAVGRTPQQLRDALESVDESVRAAAVAELSVRDEGVFLPMLRDAAARLGPETRILAIRRLGEAGREEDLPAILDATARKNDPRVRREAVLALARFPQDAAFWKLIDLAGEDALQMEAIEALRSHRRPLTVNRFIRLLRYPKHLSADAAKRITDIIYEWTGVYVRSEDKQEVASFEKWWRENQGRFTDR